MIVLDENFPEAQAELVKRAGIAFRLVGKELARKGIADDLIIPLLMQLRKPTLFSMDRDFFQRRLCHKRYSLVWLDVEREDAARFLRRVLRQPGFNTKAKRLGCVIRAAPAGVHFWRMKRQQQEFLPWDD